MTAATGSPTPDGAVWEPYRLEVGQWVRIRLSGECSCPSVEGSYFHSLGYGAHGDGSFDGLVGMVERVYDGTGFYGQRGHRYQVCVPGEYGDTHLIHAAAELVPLADHDRASEAAGD